MNTLTQTGVRSGILLAVLGLWLVLRATNEDSAGKTLIDYIVGKKGTGSNQPASSSSSSSSGAQSNPPGSPGLFSNAAKAANPNANTGLFTNAARAPLNASWNVWFNQQFNAFYKRLISAAGARQSLPRPNPANEGQVAAYNAFISNLHV